MGGVSSEEITDMEAKFLGRIRYEAHVSPRQYFNRREALLARSFRF